jgi:hypothetical protein
VYSNSSISLMCTDGSTINATRFGLALAPTAITSPELASVNRRPKVVSEDWRSPAPRLGVRSFAVRIGTYRQSGSAPGNPGAPVRLPRSDQRPHLITTLPSQRSDASILGDPNFRKPASTVDSVDVVTRSSQSSGLRARRYNESSIIHRARSGVEDRPPKPSRNRASRYASAFCSDDSQSRPSGAELH